MLIKAQYTYYTLNTVGIKVPRALKQTLTTMQIMQFIVGASFAAGHLFVYYSVPVSVPYKVAQEAAAFGSSATAAASKLTRTASASSLAASASAGIVPWINKLAAWAAGSPGVAQNVVNEEGQSFNVRNSEPLEQIRYRTVQQTVHCLDTSGQAFAIWLNCIYLAPLTGLFIRFFIKTYVFGEPRVVRSDKKSHSSRRLSASELSMSAWKQTSRSVEALGRSVERSIGTMGRELQTGGEDLMSQEDVRQRLKEAYVESTSDEKEEEEEEEETIVDGEEQAGGDDDVKVEGETNGAAG